MKATREDIAWAAGFIEGDGGFYVAKVKPKNGRGRYLRPVVAAYNTDRKILERIQKIFFGWGGIFVGEKGGKVSTSGIKTRITGYQWRVQGKKARIVVQLLFPYIVGSKRDKLLKYPKIFKISAGTYLFKQEKSPKDSNLLFR